MKEKEIGFVSEHKTNTELGDSDPGVVAALNVVDQVMRAQSIY
jgi:hypothetical protein